MHKRRDEEQEDSTWSPKNPQTAGGGAAQPGSGASEVDSQNLCESKFQSCPPKCDQLQLQQIHNSVPRREYCQRNLQRFGPLALRR